MADGPQRSRSIRFNFDLVMAEFARWPIATFVVMVLLALLLVLVPDTRLKLTPVLGHCWWRAIYFSFSE